MIIPSIDIMNGKAVQLKQGKELVLESERSPLELAREFNRYGEIAVIDLDAAMGKGNNRQIIRDICKVADARVGGGIRDAETGREYLKAGAKALIFGTAAVPEILSEFPCERVMVALDQKGGKVVDKGWTNSTGETVWERAERLTPYCGSFLTTFVENEGGLGGIDMQAVKEAKEKLKRPVTVAGGIAATDEIVEISKMGLDVQVGMALYTGRIDLADSVVGAVKFDDKGLVPIVVQDVSGKVLMLAYGNQESLKRALTEGKGIYFSRSRQEIWEKGLTSGSVQELIACRVDCDRDSLLFTVRQSQGACHTGSYSCFGSAAAHRAFAIEELFETLRQRKENAPEGSYSATLFQDRDKLSKKLMEEAFEVVSFKSRENLRWEIADLLYFVGVLAVDEGLDWKEIELELGGTTQMIPLYKGADAIAWLKKMASGSGADNESIPAPPPLTGSSASGPPLAATKHSGSFAALSIQQEVEQIINHVRREGDAAITQLASRFGDTIMPPLFMEQEGIDALAGQLPEDTVKTIDLAASRIRAFAEATLAAIRPIHVSYERFDTGLNFRPVSRVACYVPSGRFPLASTALMTAITAKVAGVSEVFILSPNLTDEILYAGTVAGVTEFHQIGGAQAVAAAAFGTKTIKPADMVVGPGNAYVTEAKRQLQGRIGIDMLAGPSEICIIADHGSNPYWLALDLLSQAEHDPDARAFLLTDDEAVATQVLAEVPKVRGEIALPDFIDESLSKSVILVMPDIVSCIAAANSIAPEHLQLHVAKPEDLQPHLVNYGALFIGYNATVPNGDYVAGPNHTLPTNRSARFAGALSPLTFLRAQTWIRVRSNANELHQETEAFANLEGLNAHAAAPRARYMGS